MESIFSTQNLQTFLRRKNLRPAAGPPGPPGPRPPGRRSPPGRSPRDAPDGLLPDGLDDPRTDARRRALDARGVVVTVLVSSAMVPFFFLPARLFVLSVGGIGPLLCFFAQTGPAAMFAGAWPALLSGACRGFRSGSAARLQERATAGCALSFLRVHGSP